MPRNGKIEVLFDIIAKQKLELRDAEHLKENPKGDHKPEDKPKDKPILTLQELSKEFSEHCKELDEEEAQFLKEYVGQSEEKVTPATIKKYMRQYQILESKKAK